MSRIDQRLQDLGLDLPEPGAPMGSYVSAVRTGNLVFLAGVGPRQPSGELVLGKLGRDLTTEQGYEAAKWCAVTLLGNLKKEIGDLDRVVRFVKLLGMVNCDSEFTQPPAVVNGCSDLLVQVFGDVAKHARSAIGVASLPNGMAVEVEAIVEVKD